MTKEGILDEFEPTRVQIGYDHVDMVDMWERGSIEQAMEQFAKEQATEFINWIFLSDIFKSKHPIDEGKYYYNKTGDLAANNTDELYSIFLK